MNKEFLLPIGVVLISLAFLDPFMILMPQNLVYVLVAALFLAFMGYSLLIWREIAVDEREVSHRAYAGRMSFMIGTAILVIGILYEVLIQHSVDGFLVLTLVGMTLTKYITHEYAEKKY